MSQQINLFNPVLLKQKKYFSAATMAQSFALLLIGSLLIAGYTHYQLSRLSKAAIENNTKLVMATEQLNSLSALYGSGISLEVEISNREAELQAVQNIFSILKNGQLGSTQGYAEYMRAFSRQSIAGLWLTRFSIYGSGDEISLHGRALQPALVPTYLQRLGSEPALKGKSFSEMRMQVPGFTRSQQDEKISPGNEKKYIEFSLQSSGINALLEDEAGDDE